MMFAEKIPVPEGDRSDSDLNTTFDGQELSPTAPLALISNATFAARYCVHQGIEFEQFNAEVLRETLYPLAKQLRTFLGLSSAYFAPDREFVDAVGRVSTIKELDAVVADFTDSRSNDGFVRGVLRLRVSARRLRRLARKYMFARRGSDPVEETEAPELTLLTDLQGTRKPFPSPAAASLTGGPRGPIDRPPVAPVPERRKSSHCDISRMQQEIDRLTEQREVLKKTVGIFCEVTPPKTDV